MRALLARFARRWRPSEFAVGVAWSLRFHPSAWDYSGGEGSLICARAELRISLYSLTVETTKRVNSGTETIAKFVGADRRAFRKVFSFWKKATATERSQVAERRKRDALAALGVRS